jgi:superfamily II DNA helicase RecQ
VDETLFQRLREWRLQRARAQKVSPYIVLHDSHLRAIAAHKPVTPESLDKLPGIGPKRLERYGDELIALVRKAQKGR